MSAIDDKWAALGGPGGFLGWPQDEGAGSGEMDTNPPGGRCRDFQGGSIYYKPGVGAFEVHGDIRLTCSRTAKPSVVSRTEMSSKNSWHSASSGAGVYGRDASLPFNRANRPTSSAR